MKVKDTYADYLIYCARKGNCAKTINSHKFFLEGPIMAAVGNKELSELTLMDTFPIREYGKVHGRTGEQRSVVSFRKLLQYIQLTGYRLPFDWRDIEVPKIPGKMVEYLTPDEVQRIRDACVRSRKHSAGLRTRAIIEVLLATGLRIGELASLDKKHVDFEMKEIKVVNNKTKEENIVYLTDESIEWLNRYLAARHDDEPALFTTGRGRMLPQTARGFMREILKPLGIRKHVMFHIFRKTFSTELLMNGADIKSVQGLSRHKSERTTLKYYTASNRERQKELHDKIMNTYNERKDLKRSVVNAIL